VLAAAVVIAATLAGPVLALDPLGKPAPPQSHALTVPGGEPGYCWTDIRVFYTLRYGPVAFCRRNLRYRPGALECYQFIDRVCATPDPLNGWVNSSSPLDAQVFPCPAGIEPPVCRTMDLGQLP
jgi:hypothetical protein